MTEQQKQEEKEEKSQAQLDYEAGQEFLKNLEPAQAANAFHNALIAFELEGNENGVANASDKLGDICAARGDVATAMTHYDRAYGVCQKHSDRFSLFAIEKKKAKLMYDAKDYDQAIRLYSEVLDEYGALRNPQGSVDTLETLAEIYLAKGDKNRAADAYRTVAAIHKSFKHSRHAEKFLEKAAEVEKK
ncbi:MAG: tetratricopeptide repeat protein [Desulfurivibrionaceae bacterium]|jgi:tetratricopeptide (TPR) repeat protein